MEIFGLSIAVIVQCKLEHFASVPQGPFFDFGAGADDFIINKGLDEGGRGSQARGRGS